MNAAAPHREQLSRVGRSLFDRHFSVGSAGNLSVKIDDGFLITPTNTSLGHIDPAAIAHLALDGSQQLCGDPPSKEWFFHRACYEARASIGAVIHLHSTYAAAVSCLADLDSNDCFPPLTAYQVMRLGKVPRIEYFRPGDQALGGAVGSLIQRHTAVLLANHGPVVVGRTLEAALYAAEELEETAKLFLMLHPHRCNRLMPEQIEDLQRHFPPDVPPGAP